MTDEQIIEIGKRHFREGHNPAAVPNFVAAVRECLAAASAPAIADTAKPFQERVQPWMLECFGAEIAADRIERNHRFFEEATELVQANGMTRSEAHQLVDYTFDRPVGELRQEVGGVMVTLAALCLASGANMHEAGETELARIWTKIEKIRAKQAAKPKHSPLPQEVIADTAGAMPINQCDGCRVNAPMNRPLMHTMPDGGFMACTAYRYASPAIDAAPKPCTCHPDDNPPIPCARQYALNECRAIDAAGASSDDARDAAIAALRSARHAIYMARNVNEAFDAVEALIVEAIAKESGK